MHVRLMIILGLATMLTATTAIQPVSLITNMTNQNQIDQLSQIIESLENLNVLDSSGTRCYSLIEIIKLQTAVDENAWKINIELHIEEMGLVSTERDPQMESLGNLPLSTTRKEAGCMVKNPHATLSSNIYNSSGNVSYLTSREQITNGTATDKTSTELVHDDATGALSLAQIMVISTCSTVIGLFFIVALAMRIRNYLKRNREMKHARRKSTIHSSNLSVRGSHNVSHESDLNNVKNNKMNKVVGVEPFPINRLQLYERKYILRV